LIKAIHKETNFKVTKLIDEYIWYDTDSNMDKGFLDYNDEEIKAR